MDALNRRALAWQRHRTYGRSISQAHTHGSPAHAFAYTDDFRIRVIDDVALAQSRCREHDVPAGLDADPHSASRTSGGARVTAGASACDTSG